MAGKNGGARPSKLSFAGVPLRAVQDDRLTATDWRVLVAIAAHDRFGGNGRGCIAGRARLAGMAKCEEVTASRAIARLVRFGYLKADRDQTDRRKKCYRVIYSDDDHKAFPPSANAKPDAETKVTKRSSIFWTEKSERWDVWDK